tara:strand:+ start:142 stop:1281 length:1140 start_codon:yes stop_codon:yes gene_type:complete
MAWYDKYVDGTAVMGGGGMSPQQALNIRRMEFKQQMKERKELDKYLRKQARKDRLFSRPKGSFKSKKKKAHWAWLADLEQKSPQVAAYYAHLEQQRRWSKKKKKRPYLQRSQAASPSNEARYTHDGKPILHSKVGMSGAPQFASLASMGYKSPAQMGFPTHMGVRGHKYSGPGGNPGSTYWKRQAARGTPGATYMDRGYGADRGTNIQWSLPPKAPVKPLPIKTSPHGIGVGGFLPAAPVPTKPPFEEGFLGVAGTTPPKIGPPPPVKPLPIKTSPHGIGVGGFLPPSGPGYAGAGWTPPGTGWTPPPPSGLVPNYGYSPIPVPGKEPYRSSLGGDEEWANKFLKGLWDFATWSGPTREEVGRGQVFHDLLGRPISWLP